MKLQWAKVDTGVTSRAGAIYDCTNDPRYALVQDRRNGWTAITLDDNNHIVHLARGATFEAAKAAAQHDLDTRKVNTYV